ncbi:N-acylneuraminate cytidylyltransferase [Halanaerobium congolense]|jgi:CMP-N,N'-diacetyllegionaminic acid synthase|uniref:N-acylneuraminate cytidylyltransferase n=1 Tax=Halanaerobium congolense TaxID=54121 RepID=A0A1H9ZQM0_9FIRM|nr:acylneuraminate cytidylyltransferase family protein [Halanaerobium congolense]PTX16339.1 N-acylneuraminate cytidylyltransferase [Halanaerobium congolense]SDF15237.1 N-acylneuraminate cytidylyltransferase [Halanaerobium congolense]SES83940.1 N-acylneuraminate cytidylyltransferase [Halanaerobium congolense]SFP44733.1 N-acylneuraminate cytidylyltransferase [Halanaerobium congolense]
MQDKILAIIPARSGSKGLKDKNIKCLNGKPMINYTIEAALKNEVFSNVVVSTDSQKYADIARKAGAEVPFIRPDNLAKDESTTNEVILHAISEMENTNDEYDCFMLLQPTSPLRTAENIKKAYSLFKGKNANAVVSVCETDHSPLWSNTLDNSLSLDNFLDDNKNKRRQELPTYYRLNGAIYLAQVDYYKIYNDFYNNNSFAYIMNKKESVDVDDIIDFRLAEILIEENIK